jgi:hypothetical protein
MLEPGEYDGAPLGRNFGSGINAGAVKAALHSGHVADLPAKSSLIVIGLSHVGQYTCMDRLHYFTIAGTMLPLPVAPLQITTLDTVDTTPMPLLELVLPSVPPCPRPVLLIRH